MDFPYPPAFLHAPPSASSSTSRPLRSRATSQSDTSWGINGASKLSISTGPIRGTGTSPGGSSEDQTPSPTPAPLGSSKTLADASLSHPNPSKPAQKSSGANQLLLQVPPFRRPNVGEERRRSSTSHIPIRKPSGGAGSGPSGSNSTGWSAGTPLPLNPSSRPRSPPWRYSGQALRDATVNGAEVEVKRARAGLGGGPGSILSGWTGGGLGEGNVYGSASHSSTPISTGAPQPHIPSSSSSPSSSRWWNSRSTGSVLQNPGSSSQPGHKRHTTNPGSMPSSPSMYVASGSGNYFDGSTEDQGESQARSSGQMKRSGSGSGLPIDSSMAQRTPPPPLKTRADRRAERVSRITEAFESDGSPTSPEATTTTSKNRATSQPGGRPVDGKKPSGWDVFEEIKREKKRPVSRPVLESFIPPLTRSIQTHLLTLTTRHRSISHILGEYKSLSERFETLDDEAIGLLLSLGVNLDGVDDKQARGAKGDDGVGVTMSGTAVATTLNPVENLDLLTSTIESTSQSLDDLSETLRMKSRAMDEVEEKMGKVVPLILAELDRRLAERQREIERIQVERMRREWIILILTILGSILIVCLGMVVMGWKRQSRGPVVMT